QQPADDGEQRQHGVQHHLRLDDRDGEQPEDRALGSDARHPAGDGGRHPGRQRQRCHECQRRELQFQRQHRVHFHDVRRRCGVLEEDGRGPGIRRLNLARILLGVPGSGMLSESAAQASYLASMHHTVHRIPSCNSGPNFNNCLIYALNACEEDKYDVHAQMHTDLAVVEQCEKCADCRGEGCLECGYAGERVYKRWADILYEEMTAAGADFISTPMAIKNCNLVTSCGIGNPENRWNPWRRFCANEFKNFPDTFTAADAGYPDKYLLHNHALCMFNMKSKLWWETDASGCIKAMFNFEERIARDPH